MNFKLLFLLLLLPILSGCVETKIIDDLNLITAAGIDYKDNQMQIVTTSVNYTPNKEVEDQNIEITIDKDADILDHLNRQSNHPILFGDLDVLVIGKNIAEAGLFPVIDTLQRDPNIGSRVFLVLSEDPMIELMSGLYGNSSNAMYISNLIGHNMKFRDTPKTNLHLFTSDFFQSNKGAFLPILKKIPGKKERLSISGLGIFHDEKLIHTIPAHEMFYFKLLVDKHTEGSMSINVEGNNAVVDRINTKTSFTANLESMTFEVNYTLKGVVTKYTGRKLESQIIDTLKKNTEKKIEKETLNLLKEFQEMGIDPTGVERRFKQQNRNFDKNKWKDQYKDITFKFHSKITLTESGTLE